MGRRRRLGPESAARKALIASSYRPARPEVYNLLQVPGRGQVTGRRWRIRAWGLSAPWLVCSAPRRPLWPLNFWLQLNTAHLQAQTLRAFSSGWRQCQVRSWPATWQDWGWQTGVPSPTISASKSQPSRSEKRGRMELSGGGHRIHSLAHTSTTVISNSVLCTRHEPAGILKLG